MPTAIKSPPTSSHSIKQNHLLGALTPDELTRLSPHLELVPQRLGDILYSINEPMNYAYFPTTSIASLHYVTAAGASTETAGVGYEGMVGIALFMGGLTTAGAAVVQTAGYAYRLERAQLAAEFSRFGLLQRNLLRYSQVLMTQTFQMAACNRHHSIEQQLSRWLLWTIDRAPKSELVMTQELVASMLGVRRESITHAASRLQEAGCIHYRRGHIAVIDRTKLAGFACECYATVKKELHRLAPKTG